MNNQIVTQISKEPKQQFYFITKTGLLASDNEKIIVKSYRELRDYVHNQMDWIRSDALHELSYNEDNNIKHIYKHVIRTRMYVELDRNNHTKDKAIGHVFELNCSMKNGEIEPLITYWCNKVSKRDVGNIQYSGFKEIEY